MLRFRRLCVVFVFVMLLISCAPANNIEFELEHERTIENLAEVVEFSKTDSTLPIAFPRDTPLGIRYIDFAALSESRTRTQFYYDSVRIEVCASTKSTKCANSVEGSSTANVVSSGEGRGVYWSVVAFAQPKLQVVEPDAQEYGGSFGSSDNRAGYEDPEQHDSTALILSYWELTEFTVSEVPQWVIDYSIKPEICKPTCY